jgi:hypothetical protein
MSDAPASVGPSLLGTPREWAKDLTTATAIGVFLGVIGPFGSFNSAPIEQRIFYWVGNLWIGFIITAILVRLCLRAAARWDIPTWFAVAVGVAIGSFPLGYLVIVFSAWFWTGRYVRAEPILTLYGEILAISEPLAFVLFYLRRRTDPHPGQPAPAPPPAPLLAAPPPPASFLDRLPPKLGRELLCLQMEDHYVRAHTVQGSDLILIPLRQATAELSAVEGMQVHRSWWVARAAVEGCVTNGRNLALGLRNGLQVPVSRASVAPLRAAGWLGENQPFPQDS